MIIMNNNNKINVNDKKMNNKEFNLRRLATTTLCGIGIMFTISACGNEKKVDFDYNQWTPDVSYETQFEQFYGINVDINDSVEGVLSNWDIAYDYYKLGMVGEVEDLKSRRLNFINATNELCNAGKYIIKEKTGDALGESDINSINIFRIPNNADGPKTGITIGDDRYDIPEPLRKIMEDIEAIEDYKGNGTSEAWDDPKVMESYINDSVELYNTIGRAFKFNYEQNNKGDIASAKIK